MRLNRAARTVLFILAVASLLLLTGCVTEYEREDIETFVRENYRLRDFEVARQSVPIQDQEGYTDQYWQVTMTDGSGVVFGVLDDYFWGMEATTNMLRCDYEDVMLLHLAESYAGFDQVQIKHSREEGLTYAELIAGYGTRAELSARFEELMDFRDYVLQTGYTVEHSMRVRFEMESELRSRMQGEGELSYTVTDGDYTATLTGLDQSAFEKATGRFVRACVDYRLMSQLEDFTEEEIQSALEGSMYRLGIYPDEDQAAAPRMYEDLSASNYAYGVSFGTLYEVLRRENLAVWGDSWHYGFTGLDGAAYEVSYDFYAKNPALPEAPNYYYYLRNGEQIWMDHYFYNHFTESQVKEMTGLSLYIGQWPEVQEIRQTDRLYGNKKNLSEILE